MHLTRQHWLLIALVVGAVGVALVVALLPMAGSDCIGGGPGELPRQCVQHQPNWLAGALVGIAAYFVGVAFTLSVRSLSKP